LAERRSAYQASIASEYCQVAGSRFQPQSK
jgi:hypothetical protein